MHLKLLKTALLTTLFFTTAAPAANITVANYKELKTMSDLYFAGDGLDLKLKMALQRAGTLQMSADEFEELKKAYKQATGDVTSKEMAAWVKLEEELARAGLAAAELQQIRENGGTLQQAKLFVKKAKASFKLAKQTKLLSYTSGTYGNVNYKNLKECNRGMTTQCVQTRLELGEFIRILLAANIANVTWLVDRPGPL